VIVWYRSAVPKARKIVYALCHRIRICVVCNNVAENHRLDITYENNLIIKLVLVSIQLLVIYLICIIYLYCYSVVV